MKKIFYSVAFSTLVIIGVSSCKQGNAEEMMKQDTEKISSMVQTKLDELNTKLDEECTAKIAEEAQKQFDAMPKTSTKTASKTPVKKPTTKPTTPPKTTTPPPNTNVGKKDVVTGTNEGKKDATTTPQGQNLGKKK